MDLVRVPFHGETLEAAKQDGRVWVSIKRVCESLGVNADSQRAKLQGKPWANTALIAVLDAAGRNFEVACLDLDSLPMWLATIEPSRVKPEVRGKLALYQKEAARVLADHFFGRPQAQPLPLADAAALAREVAREVACAVAEAISRQQLSAVREFITVDDRCRLLWPGASPRNRRRVRDIAIGTLLARYGRRPLKRGDLRNAEYGFEREDLHILDEAVQRAKDELEPPAPGLFVAGSA